MGPSASVIPPTFKRLDDVTRCLESLLGQQSSDFEVMVVDNGGEDAVRHRPWGFSS
jgi:glycosyltransferase involved in cell wall biosynthesis